MDELEISETLRPLTPKRAAEWFLHQKKEMGRTAVSVYLFVAQDGLRQANVTFGRYCEEIGIEERTARYWISRVKATMVVNDITDITLLDQYELSAFNTALVPQAAAGEILRLPAAQAKEAWREWSAIRNEPTLANRGNAASFRRITERKFPPQKSEFNSDFQDQNPPKTTQNQTAPQPPKTEPNTQYKGPWCEACGDVCKVGEVMCDDCIADAVSADPLPEGEPVTDPAILEKVEQAQRENILQCAIKQLNACSAENHKSQFFWIVKATDGNGNEYVMQVPQKMLDLAPIK